MSFTRLLLVPSIPPASPAVPSFRPFVTSVLVQVKRRQSAFPQILPSSIDRTGKPVWPTEDDRQRAKDKKARLKLHRDTRKRNGQKGMLSFIASESGEGASAMRAADSPTPRTRAVSGTWSPYINGRNDRSPIRERRSSKGPADQDPGDLRGGMGGRFGLRGHRRPSSSDGLLSTAYSSAPHNRDNSSTSVHETEPRFGPGSGFVLGAGSRIQSIPDGLSFPRSGRDDGSTEATRPNDRASSFSTSLSSRLYPYGSPRRPAPQNTAAHDRMNITGSGYGSISRNRSARNYATYGPSQPDLPRGDDEVGVRRETLLHESAHHGGRERSPRVQCNGGDGFGLRARIDPKPQYGSPLQITLTVRASSNSASAPLRSRKVSTIASTLRDAVGHEDWGRNHISRREGGPRALTSRPEEQVESNMSSSKRSRNNDAGSGDGAPVTVGQPTRAVADQRGFRSDGKVSWSDSNSDRPRFKDGSVNDVRPRSGPLTAGRRYFDNSPDTPRASLPARRPWASAPNANSGDPRHAFQPRTDVFGGIVNRPQASDDQLHPRRSPWRTRQNSPISPASTPLPATSAGSDLASSQHRSSHRDSAAPAPATTTGWSPTKKLTYAAMAGLRALHAADPKVNNRAALSEKFGVSYDAVGRILRSTWREKQEQRAGVASEAQKGDEQDSGLGLATVHAPRHNSSRTARGSRGDKGWVERKQETEDFSPVPIIRRALEERDRRRMGMQ